MILHRHLKPYLAFIPAKFTFKILLTLSKTKPKTDRTDSSESKYEITNEVITKVSNLNIDFTLVTRNFKKCEKLLNYQIACYTILSLHNMFKCKKR